MAFRADSATEGYIVNDGAGLPPAAVATILSWFMISVDRNAFQTVWVFGTTGALQVGLGTDSDGTTLTLFDRNFANQGATALTVGGWYRAAAVLNGTAWTLHLGVGGAALTTTTAARAAISAPPVMELARNIDWWNGRVANVKVYAAALSVDECERELQQYQPARTENLLRWHPFLTAETVDYSGAGNTLTVSGSPFTEDGPPIRWRATAAT